tara:strand:- start:1029 stop:1466 length:438 start_codon:yes stop_codon:yes gene_type:complete
MKLVNLNSRPLSIFDDLSKIMNTVLDNDIYKPKISECWIPAVDINEDNTSFVLTADIPGLNKSDIDISVEDNILKISGAREYKKTDESTECHFQERNHGKFFRSFKLPLFVDEENISAAFNNGILTIILPKTEEAKPKLKSIKIK